MRDKMYELGQWIKKIENGQRVQVLEVFETWGYSSLKVYNPEEKKIEFLSADRVLEEWDQEIDANYIKYKIVLLKLLQEISQGMLTSLKEGVIPLPHQLYVLKRALSESRIRYVLADEVGLGKTIEAGLIIRELKARGLVKRVLIICPKGLVSQWNLELKEKFDEYFNIILPSEYEVIKRIINKEQVYSQFDQVISPMDSIKPIERRAGWTQEEIDKYNEERIYSIIESDWDLIIIDEAHRLAGSSDQVARYKLGKMLSKASPYLLLLTATPHSGKTDQFLRLLGLLDQDAFPNYQSLVKENVSQYIIRTEKREAIDNKGKGEMMEYRLKIDNMFEELTKVFKGEVLKDEPLKNHTYFKIGGPAGIFAVPEDMEDLKVLLKEIKKHEIDYYIIGNGTNLLVSDEGFKGIIVKIGEKFDKLKRDGNKVTAGAGILLL
jgi:SNF2 family DNA or RNA helicase